MFTNVGRSGVALLIGPSGTRPNYISLGSGSAAVAVTRTGLVAERTGAAYTSTTITPAQEITFISDFSSTTMSGLILREFGVKVSGLNNHVWSVEGLAGVTFTGSAELQVEINWRCF